MTRLLGVICLVSLWSVGCTSDPKPQGLVTQDTGTQATVADDLVITNARIIDGNGSVIERGMVVIRDGRIASVAAESTVVAGAQVIDATGLTVMPGFIDAHRHLIDGDPAQWLNEQAAPRMQEFLDAGFTTVLSAGDPAEQILELRRRLNAGEINGPRLISAGRAPLARPAGSAAGTAGAPRVDPARVDVSRPPDRPTRPAIAIPEEETRATVRRLKETGFDAIKTVIIVTPGGPEQSTLKTIVDEARRVGLPVITHAVTVQDTLAAVDAGVTTLVHTPHIGQLNEADVRKIAGSGIPMTTTLGIFVPGFAEDNQLMRERTGDDNTPRFRDLDSFPMDTLSSAGQGPVNARMLWDAGVTYGYGTDVRFVPRDALRHELRPLRLVFSAKDIVKLMTVNSAALIDRGGDLGTLAAGKIADVVVLDGNPLEDVENLLKVRLVIKDGKIVADHR